MTTKDLDSSGFILGPRYFEPGWYFRCPALRHESAMESFNRIYRSIISDLIEPFGNLVDVTLHSVSDGVIRVVDLPLSPDGQKAGPLDAIPDDPLPAAALTINAHVQTASGSWYQGLYPVTVLIEGAEDGAGIEIDVSLTGTVFRPPGPDASQLEMQQYENNRHSLPTFLRALTTRLNLDFVGRAYEELGPFGFLEPGTSQSGLPPA